MCKELEQLCQKLGEKLQSKGLTMATAESCTGGLIAKAATDIPGSSSWFEAGFITYSNAAKREMLGVHAATLDASGAVSEAVVREMVQGALARSRASVVVAVSGIAGPGGGTQEKPVGTVWLAWSLKGGEVLVTRRLFPGDRRAVRRQTAIAALEGVLKIVD